MQSDNFSRKDFIGKNCYINIDPSDIVGASGPETRRTLRCEPPLALASSLMLALGLDLDGGTFCCHRSNNLKHCSIS